MKLIIPMIVVAIIGMLIAQTFSLAGMTKKGVDAIHGENGVYDCGFKLAEARNMPINSPEEIAAKNEFMKGCKKD